MVVHPGPGHPTGTLVNAVLAHCDLPPALLQPGALHGSGVCPHVLYRTCSGVGHVRHVSHAHVVAQ